MYCVLLSLFYVHLIYHGFVSAINGAILYRNNVMASLDLLPDGSPMGGARKSSINGAPVRTVQRQTEPAPKNDTWDVPEEFVTLPLDHFGESNETFQNRFWVSTADYLRGSPVFLYDVGEGNASLSALQRLMNETGFFRQLVQEFHGIGIVWEHRFYGASTPVHISVDTPATAFRYLTTAQALADVPAFAWNFSRPGALADVDLTPAGTPWVFVGGSYPGMRAAFARDAYPETIFAAWASSAPVQAAVDMSFYWDPVWRGMQRYGWGNCTRDIRAAVRRMDELMEDPVESFILKQKLLGESAGNNTNAGLADAVSTVMWLWQSYGVDGGDQGLRSFCDHISFDPETNMTSDAQGWAAAKGPDWTISRWAVWPFFADTVNDNLYTKCDGNLEAQNAKKEIMDRRIADALASMNETELAALNVTRDNATEVLESDELGIVPERLQSLNDTGPGNVTQILESDLCIGLAPDDIGDACSNSATLSNITEPAPAVCNLDQAFREPHMISWTWQYCTEWGFMQSYNPGDRQLVSKFNSQSHQHDMCHRQFPDGRAAGLPEWPDVDATNAQFGGWAIRPSNTLWTMGELDPWRTLSPFSDVGVAPKYTTTRDIPECNKEAGGEGDALFTYILPEAQHAYDFRTTFNGSEPVRVLFNDALKKWLECWKPGSKQKPGMKLASPAPRKENLRARLVRKSGRLRRNWLRMSYP